MAIIFTQYYTKRNDVRQWEDCQNSIKICNFYYKLTIMLIYVQMRKKDFHIALKYATGNKLKSTSRLYCAYEGIYLKGVCGEFCTEKWPNASSRRAYTMVVLVAQFVIPFIVMAFCYAVIFARLRTRARLRLQRINERCSFVLEKTNSPSSMRHPRFKAVSSEVRSS